MTILRYLWALPNTVLGLTLGLVAIPDGHLRVVDGVIEISGGKRLKGFFRWLGKVSGTGVAEAGAICLGHVILAPSLAANAACRAHERIHVRQYESFGPFYLVLYHWWAWYLHRHGRHRR